MIVQEGVRTIGEGILGVLMFEPPGLDGNSTVTEYLLWLEHLEISAAVNNCRMILAQVLPSEGCDLILLDYDPRIEYLRASLPRERRP